MSAATLSTTETLHLTLTPAVSTPVTLRTTPGAACTIRHQGDTDPTRKLKIYADTEGIIQFHVTPSAEHDDIASFLIESVAEGETTHHAVHLRSSHTPTPEMPAPVQQQSLRNRPAGKIRPALALDDALRLTDEQALAGGYPLRPNQDEVPQAFQSWLKAVSTPTTVIEPQLITDPEITHGKGVQAGPATFTNWSGFELDRSQLFRPIGGSGLTPPYDTVVGEWVVPAVTSEFNKTTYSTLWVGLDGDATPDLVQAGTEQDSMNVTITLPFGGSPVNYTISTYYAWTEFLPQQPFEQKIANFAVHPGDLIYTQVWIGNAGDPPSLSGAFAFFILENLTTHVSTYLNTPVGTTRVGGSEAVWIMERPTLTPSNGNPFLPDLANYNSATLSIAIAHQANSAANQGYVDYQGLRNKQISMINGANTLSTVTPIDATSMRFNWQRFN
jgi:hypothetical protein